MITNLNMMRLIAIIETYYIFPKYVIPKYNNNIITIYIILYNIYYITLYCIFLQIYSELPQAPIINCQGLRHFPIPSLCIFKAMPSEVTTISLLFFLWFPWLFAIQCMCPLSPLDLSHSILKSKFPLVQHSQ